MDLERALPIRPLSPASNAADRWSSTQWLICIVAGVGFLFDAYEMLVQSLIVRPALLEVSTLKPGTREFNTWVGLVMYLPFLAGGVAGLVGGYLTDRVGRRRVLIWSIVVYGVATVGAAAAASATELLVWRCLTIIGVCTEWVAATAWIAELFSDRRQREAALGFTQAFAGIGIFLVALVYYLGVTYGHTLPPIQGSHAGWRYSLLFGALPVIPVLLMRLYVPESPRWQERKSAGTLQRPRFRELLGPAYRRATLIGCVLAACIYALAFGASQQMPRIVPGLAQVRSLPPLQQEQAISLVHLTTDLGGLAGRVIFALLAITYLSRRNLLRAFQWPALVAFPLLYAISPHLDVWLLACGVLITGALQNAQLSFLGNYLPQLYPVRLRGTGESFAMSVGGRIIGPLAVLLTTSLANFTTGANPSQQRAYAAAIVSVLACAGGVIVSRHLPEPQHSND